MRKNAEHIGRNLRHLRSISGLTQGQVALALDVSYQQIQKYEAGSNRLPVDKLYQLKSLYNVPYEMFFSGFGGSIPLDQSSEHIRSAQILTELSCLKDYELKKKIEDILLILLN